MSDFEARVRAMPLAYRFPCGTCEHLKDQGQEHYVRCGCPLPPIPFRIKVDETWREMTRKQVFGPFQDGAVPVGCPTYTPKGDAASD